MYKLLLCLRYLRSRYIALASVVSVMLGVATLIVVNGVMEGFTREMQGRIHGILADVVFEAHNLEGFPDAAGHMRRIRELAGDYIAGMTPTVAVPGQLAYRVDGHWHTRHVTFIGVDTASYGQVSDFSQYLKHPLNRRQLSFELRDGGYGDRAATDEANRALKDSGWPRRRRNAASGDLAEESIAIPSTPSAPGDAQATPPATLVVNGYRYHRAQRSLAPENAADVAAAAPVNPFLAQAAESRFDPAREAHTGVVLGVGLSSVKNPDGSDRFLVLPGDDVKITVPTAGKPPKAASGTFTVVDFYQSGMSEYDENFIFVPLATLQEMRGMFDPQTQMRSVTSIQIKLHDEADGEKVRDLLRAAFPGGYYGVQTWRDKQGPLLAAVGMQTVVLNILLLLIIAVAGFGILAILCMIVAEKTRDIGILKSLGASNLGIMLTFLNYGWLLGVVGAGAGLAIGLAIIANINRVADGLARLTGRDVFDPSIYYFQEIPTLVRPLTVALILIAAVWIAVLASIVPAFLAARLHPVEALRHE
jgi:lipoprotein-releasing system permease protein